MILEVIHMFSQMVLGKKYEDLPPEKQEIGKNLLVWLQACTECGQCEEKCPYNLPTITRKNALIEMFSR